MIQRLLSFFRPEIRDFDEACVLSFSAARQFAGYNNRTEITPADLLRGMLHADTPESTQFRSLLKFGYGDEVEAIKKLHNPGNGTRFGSELELSTVVKKILARANQSAAAKKRDRVNFIDLLRGLVVERPHDVSNDLAKVGKNWGDLERFAKTD
jgi:ATP-dependent Clp protease ATP-binding subunit ClpA